MLSTLLYVSRLYIALAAAWWLLGDHGERRSTQNAVILPFIFKMSRGARLILLISSAIFLLCCQASHAYTFKFWTNLDKDKDIKRQQDEKMAEPDKPLGPILETRYFVDWKVKEKKKLFPNP